MKSGAKIGKVLYFTTAYPKNITPAAEGYHLPARNGSAPYREPELKATTPITGNSLSLAGQTQYAMNAIPLPDDFGLRPLRADDAPDIFTAIDTQREHLGRWLPFVAATHRVEQTREVVAAMLADPANPVFTLRVGDAFAGLIGFKSADSTTLTIEIGYWLRSEYQGRGLMTAAAEALCRMAFGQMGMENVEIKCAAGNLRSNRIPLRLGFRLDRIEVRGEQLADGEFTDLNVYRLPRP